MSDITEFVVFITGVGLVGLLIFNPALLTSTLQAVNAVIIGAFRVARGN